MCLGVLRDRMAEDHVWLRIVGHRRSLVGTDTGDAEMPKEHFLEWLAEWGREVRRRQSGLLLLTAHRAKGLEFELDVG